MFETPEPEVARLRAENAALRKEVEGLKQKLKNQADDIGQKNTVIIKLRGDKKALGEKLYKLKRQPARGKEKNR
jgi:chromosome segregation ATPase